MNILKKVGLGLLFIAGLILIVSVFLPGSVTVTRSLSINAPQPLVFEQINTLKNWERWSPWHRLDPNMKLSYSGPESGKDAAYAWSSEHKNVGNGTITILGSYPSDSISTEMNFMENGIAKGFYTFKTEDSKTTVTWGMKNDLPFYARIFGLFLDKMIGPDFEKGLHNLDSVCQLAKKTPMVSQEFKETELPARIYLAVTDSASGETISEKFGAAYQRIGECMKKNKLEMAGAPSAFYYKNTPEMMVFDAVIAVSAEPKDLPKGVRVLKKEACKTIAVDYYGDYSKMYTVFGTMMEYIKDKGLEANAPHLEEYITDPMSEKDTSKWLTKIYIPLK